MVSHPDARPKPMSNRCRLEITSSRIPGMRSLAMRVVIVSQHAIGRIPVLDGLSVGPDLVKGIPLTTARSNTRSSLARDPSMIPFTTISNADLNSGLELHMR